jgi:Arc/MetJ family transcription regulator
MQTTILIDNELVERVQQITGIKGKNQAVQEALRALVSLREPVKRKNARPQKAVIKSLERSLKENADVWSELAKH